MITLKYAPDAWRALNGVICVYKPPETFSCHIRRTLKFNITRDLNEMEKRRPNDRVLLKGSVISGKAFSVELVPNYADHELVSGPRYQVQDVRLAAVSDLGKQTSGVLICTLNNECRHRNYLQSSNFLRKYEVKGRFGCASSNFMADGKIRERSTFSHIRLGALDRLLTSIQSSHQALAYRFSGVAIQSQTAYELASKGLVRPSGKSDPIIYGMKCTHFHLPDFTLEIQCINEDETFLAEMIHQIGVYMKSSAICTQLRRTQFGHFTLEHALLRKHWTLEHILNNVTLCKKLVQENVMPGSAHFDPVQVSELKQTVIDMQEEIREDAL